MARGAAAHTTDATSGTEAAACPSSPPPQRRSAAAAAIARVASRVGLAVALRLLLAALGAGEALIWQPEVSTPANTLLKTREGLRLLSLGSSPYGGGTCHTPPLWLAVAAGCAQHRLLYVLPGTVADLVGATALAVTAAALFDSSRWPHHTRDAPWLSPQQLALLYLFNPVVLLSCVAGSTTPAENAALLVAVAGGCVRNGPLAGFGLAAAAYLGLQPLLMLVPVLLLLWQGPEDVLQNVALGGAGGRAAVDANSKPSHSIGTNDADFDLYGDDDDDDDDDDCDGDDAAQEEAGGAQQQQQQQRQHVRRRRRSPASRSTVLQQQQQQRQRSSSKQRSRSNQQQQQQRQLWPPWLCLGALAACAAALLLLSDRVVQQHPGAQCVPALWHALLAAAAGSEAGNDVTTTAAAAAAAAAAGGPAARVRAALAGCWAGRVYGLTLGLTDLTPTIGLWWYFFTEVFAEFRPFFLFVFHSFAPALAVPLALRFSRRPLFATWALAFACAMFRPYACVGGMAPWLGLLPLLQQQLGAMRLRLFLVNAFVLLCVLGPAMWHQWIELDSANANFFYSITLLLGVWCTLLLMQLLRLTALLERCLAGRGPPPRMVALTASAGRQAVADKKRV